MNFQKAGSDLIYKANKVCDTLNIVLSGLPADFFIPNIMYTYIMNRYITNTYM